MIGEASKTLQIIDLQGFLFLLRWYLFGLLEKPIWRWNCCHDHRLQRHLAHHDSAGMGCLQSRRKRHILNCQQLAIGGDANGWSDAQLLKFVSNFYKIRSIAMSC